MRPEDCVAVEGAEGAGLAVFVGRVPGAVAPERSSTPGAHSASQGADGCVQMTPQVATNR